MSLNNIISTSLSGLFASQAALRSTSNNVANVNTPHYSRTRVDLEANVTQGQTAGVKISDVSRVVDQFLETALRTATSNSSEFTAQREFHDRLQGILGDPAADSSLSSRIDQIFSSVADLTLNPADVLRRQKMLSEMQSFMDQTSLFQKQIQNLRGEASQQVSENVEAINEQLQRIHDLNPLLASQRSTGGDSGGLEGQMAQALAALSELVDIKIDRQPSGKVNVSTSDGYPLVDTSLSQLKYNAPGIVESSTVFPTITISRVDDVTLQPTSTEVDFASHIRSGRLAGLLDMRDTQLVDLSVSLGELGARVADEFNAVNNKFSAVPPPNTMTGKQTIVDGAQAHNFTGKVTFAAVNSSNQLVGKVEVDFDASGAPATFDALISFVNGHADMNSGATLALTNGVMSFTGASGNGVVIADDTTTPSQRAGRGFSHFFGMNDLVTADKPGVYETGVTGSQTHGIANSSVLSFRVLDANSREITTVSETIDTSTNTTYANMVTMLNQTSGMGAYFTFSLDDATGGLTWTPKAGFEGAKLQVASDNTNIGSGITPTARPTGVSFSQAFGMGDSYRADAAKGLKVVDAVNQDPSLLSLSQFDFSVPAPAGPAVGAVVLTNGDQRGALAYQSLETLLVDFADAGELNKSNVTLSQYVSRFLGNAGLQAARASNFEEDNLALQEEIGKRNSDISGVNLDEELANLVVYQNSYNAAAKILSTVQQLYDGLLAAV
ncbi:MAG: flagellar hook-associated protein FlgK [Kordiimonas sp.]